MNPRKSTKRMPKWRRILVLFFLASIVILILAASVLAKIKARQGLPDYTEDITLKNLKYPVDVFRDDFGTPHIFAHTEEDLYRSVGYLMAQERLWQMDMLRRITLGRLSELLGENFVKTDLLMRSLRFSEKSLDILQKSNPEIILHLTAFCDGVNQCIDNLGEDLPLEFTLLRYKPDKWEMHHSLNLISFMAWELKSGWNELMLEEIKQKVDSSLYHALLLNNSLQKEYVYPGTKDNVELLSTNSLLEFFRIKELGFEVFSGSNNWAVAGTKSKTGYPILANDMHLELNIPGIWMQMHQVVEGKLNVSGLVLPGQPLVIVGHNDSIAWGMTNTVVDNLDYYEERINPNNKNQYFYNEEWKTFDSTQVKIISKDTVYNLSYRCNHRGPVVTQDVNGKVLTVKWIGSVYSDEFLSIYKVNRANNWSSFKEAFSTFRSISQNIVYADVDGNIGLYTCAGVPIRKRDAVFRILPGWTNEYDWVGLVPFEELPHEYNPSRGYVSSANNRTTDSLYNYHIGTWYSLPYRIERIRELLEINHKLSVQDFINIQNDAKSKFSLMQVEKLFVLIDEEELNALELEIAHKLKCWDGNMDKDLIEPSIAEVFNWIFVRQIFKDELGDELFEKFEKNNKIARIAVYNILKGDGNSPWLDKIDTPETENINDIVNITYKETIQYLINNYRKDTRKWKWKYLHKITFKHPVSKSFEALDFVFKLNRGPYGVSGGKHTVSPYSYPMFEPENVFHGASHRHIFSLQNWDSTLSVLPTGNSGIVSSEFYCDQTENYVKGRYNNDFFYKETIEKTFKYLIRLYPAE
jgi:penicillin amidase